MPPVLGEAKEGSKRAAPAFSITGRGKDIGEKTPMPGPGTYTPAPALAKRPPAYTMAPRREHKAPTAAVPGPGVYCPEKVIHHITLKSQRRSSLFRVQRIWHHRLKLSTLFTDAYREIVLLFLILLKAYGPAFVPITIWYAVSLVNEKIDEILFKIYSMPKDCILQHAGVFCKPRGTLLSAIDRGTN